jgi:hypothetical protein
VPLIEPVIRDLEEIDDHRNSLRDVADRPDRVQVPDMSHVKTTD